jgi:drug/metabolite transporter (DMT)-like permease
MAFYQNAVYGLGALAIAGVCAALGLVKLGHPSLDFLVRPWVAPSMRDLVLMGLCGVIAAVAMSLLTQAYRLAEAKSVAVVEYTVMIWAPLWGYLIFSETPRLTTLAGMGLILAAGLYGAGSPETQALSMPAAKLP